MSLNMHCQAGLRFFFIQMAAHDLANLGIRRLPQDFRRQSQLGSVWRKLNLRRVKGHDEMIIPLRRQKSNLPFF